MRGEAVFHSKQASLPESDTKEMCRAIKNPLESGFVLWATVFKLDNFQQSHSAALLLVNTGYYPLSKG